MVVLVGLIFFCVLFLTLLWWKSKYSIKTVSIGSAKFGYAPLKDSMANRILVILVAIHIFVGSCSYAAVVAN